MCYAIALVSILCYVFAFPPFDASELIYIFAAPFLTWAYYCKSNRKIFLFSILVGTVSWMLLLIWLRHLSYFVVIGLGTFIGSFMGIWLYLASTVIKKTFHATFFRRLASLLALTALWVILEWIRGWIFTGFPWLPLSASMWLRPGLLQILEFTGSSGIAFIIIFFNLALTVYFIQVMNKKRFHSVEIYIAALLLLGLIALHVYKFPRYQDSEPMFKVAIIQPHVPSSMKWESSKIRENIKILDEETKNLINQDTDWILWPETAITSPLNQNNVTKYWVEQLSSLLNAPMAVGAIGQIDTRFYNGMFFVSPKTGLNQQFYAKRKRVPFGEYVPLRSWLPFVEKFVPAKFDLVAGKGAEPNNVQIGEFTWKLGGLICYEDIFSNLVGETVQAGADVLLVLTNSGWYGQEGMPKQHASHAVLRAIEYRRPIIRCGNFGWSGWIDEHGRIRGVMNSTGDVFYRGSEVFDVHRNKKMAEVSTFYSKHGDWFVYTCFIILIFGYLLNRKYGLHL